MDFTKPATLKDFDAWIRFAMEAAAWNTLGAFAKTVGAWDALYMLIG